jgi:DNA-binding PadR family transcriptional regulator
MAEILNFMNGERSAYEIARHVSVEYTPTNTERILKYLKDLERTQLIAFQ